MRHCFAAIFLVLFALTALLAVYWPAVLWSLLITVPLFLVGVRDVLQSRHTVLRKFSPLGHGRYFIEMVRPEIQQYFIETDIDAFPIEREFRSLVHRRAKDQLETQPYGTQRDVNRVGYEWATHSIAARPARADPPRIVIGGEQCSQPYRASVLNISAMRFGSISGTSRMRCGRRTSRTRRRPSQTMGFTLCRQQSAGWPTDPAFSRNPKPPALAGGVFTGSSSRIQPV